MTDQPMTLYNLIEQAKPKFELILAEDDTGVDWEKESVFAYQALSKNRFTMDVARQNPDSVRLAMINVASVGLTLNPALGYAFLVPRDGAICLDIGYQGLIKIATDTGSIKWAKAELVYQGDEFIYKGPATPPEHNIHNPFGGYRGKTITDKEHPLIGVYCIAKTHDDDYLVELMNADEIIKIRSEAKSMMNEKSRHHSPWFENNYPGEMAKKTCIKRSQKTWPKTQRHERLQQAVSFMNETEGSDWKEETHRFKPGEKEQIVDQMRQYLSAGDDLGVAQLVTEYVPDPRDSEENELQGMRFWSLFTSQERNCIHRLMNDKTIELDRIQMKREDLNQPLELEE